MTDMLLRLVRVLMLLLGILGCALGPSRAAAQESDREPLMAPQQIDEFGELRGCDAGARLDNFAIFLQNDPAAVGYVISYGPEGEGYGTGRGVLEIITDYLVNSRGVGAERFKMIYAGRYKEWKEIATELWIAPPDAAPPEPLRYETTVEPFTGKFEEFEAYDNRADSYLGEGTGPSLSGASRAIFADLLRQQTETRALVVAYNMKGAVPGAWRRAAKAVADNLQNNYKVEAGRIEIIYAGYRERKEKRGEDDEPPGDALVQLWILPKDAPPPVTAVKEAEERPLEAILLGSFDSVGLADTEEARRAFEGFADVLRSDEQLNACLIVRVEKEAQERVGDEETPKAEETPKPDAIPVGPDTDMARIALMIMIEKWRANLVKDYGISEHRLVVRTAAQNADGDYQVETWIVPQGAALPDPNVKDEPVNDQENAVEEEIVTDEDTQKEF